MTIAVQETHIHTPHLYENKPTTMEPEKHHHSGRTVAPKQSKTTINYKGLGLKRKICIFLRSIKKIAIATYYILQVRIFKKPIETQEQINNITGILNPITIKLLQPYLKKELFEPFARSLLCIQHDNNLSEHEECRVNTVIKKIFNNLNMIDSSQLTTDEAQEIIERQFNKKYTVEKCLGSGTVASCFQIKDENENTYVAKIIRDDNINNIVESAYLLQAFSWMTAASKRKITEIMNEAFMDECSLLNEGLRLKEFHTALSSTKNTNQCQITEPNNGELFLTKSNVNSFDVNTSAPKVIEENLANNLLIMEKIDGDSFVNLTSDRGNYLKKVDTFLGRESNNEDLTQITDIINKTVADKWSEMVFKKKIIHGDLHPGNTIISFTPKQSINIGFIDLGNSLKISDENIESLRIFSSCLDAFKNIESNQTQLTEVFGDRLYQTFIGSIDSTKISFAVKNANVKEILESMSQEEAEIVKKLYNELINQTENHKISEKDKEHIQGAIYFILSIHREPQDFLLCNEIIKPYALDLLLNTLIVNNCTPAKWLTRFKLATQRFKYAYMNFDYLHEKK